MGPRSIDRGNLTLRPPLLSCVHWLQWGRDRSIAEMSSCRPRTPSISPLQWGRDRSIAEIIPARPRSGGQQRELQWGRDRSIAEIAPILTYSDFKDLAACL